MRGVRCASKQLLKAICPLLAEAAFLPASGQCSVQRQQIRFAGAGNSAGPFARPRPRFRAATRSTFPSFAFATTRENFANPFDLRLLRSVRFRGRPGANSSPQTRYPRPSTALPLLRRSRLPDWPLQPFGSKRSIAPATESSLCDPSDSPSLPAAYSVRFALRINVPDSLRFAQRIVP
jgi:hypothetical protein